MIELHLMLNFKHLVQEIDRIASVTTFNGTQLLDGSVTAALTFQVGANFNDTAGADDQVITLDLADSDATVATLFAGAAVAAGDAGDVLAQVNANQALEDIDAAIQVCRYRSGQLRCCSK